MIVDWPRWARKFIWLPCALILAFAPLLASQVLQMCSVVVWPFSRPAFRRINTTLAGFIWGYWARGLQSIVGVQVAWDKSSLPFREDAIVIANHQSMSDISVLLCLALEKGSIGHLKWLVKDIIKYIPGIGWGMLFLDCVYLKRDWNRDSGTIQRVFSRINDNRLPVWLVSFPEGTRATREKIASARRLQHANDGYENVLSPRPRGFVASVQGLATHVTAVYAVTIAYQGGAPGLLAFISGDCRRVELQVVRTASAQLPQDTAALTEWLRGEFRRMDAFLSQARQEPPSSKKPVTA